MDPLATKDFFSVMTNGKRDQNKKYIKIINK